MYMHVYLTICIINSDLTKSDLFLTFRNVNVTSVAECPCSIFQVIYSVSVTVGWNAYEFTR